MSIEIKPYAVYWVDDGIKLFVRTNDALKQITEKMIQPQLEVIYIQLVNGSFPQRRRMFNMPNALYLNEEIIFVENGLNMEIKLEVAEESAGRLDTMVRALIGDEHINPDHKYHLLLSAFEKKENSNKDASLGGLFAA